MGRLVEEQIAILPKVKLRLGRIGVDGEQKGVDLRIGLDMVGHARNGAVDTMYLISGDDDLTEAVEEAQAQGVQVVILAVPTAAGTPQGVSRHLRLAADDIEVLTSRILDGAVTAARKVDGSTPGDAVAVPQPVLDVVPAPGGVPTPADLVHRISAGGESGSSSAPAVDPQSVRAAISTATRRTYNAWTATASDAAKEELHAGRPAVPRDLDRALLVDVSEALKTYTLDDRTRVQLRTEFWRTVDEG